MCTTSNDTNEGDLILISREEWCVLRDLYLRDYPKNIVSYYNLKMYIEWIEKNPQLDDINIYTIDTNWRKHGTYIIKDQIGSRFNVLFNTLSDDNISLVFKALNNLNIRSDITLCAYAENIHPAVKQYMGELGFTDLKHKLYPTKLYYLPKEESLKLEINAKPGYIVKPLTVANIKQVDDLWPHQYPGSDYFIGRMIRNNLTLGVFDESNDELCAWVLLSELGTLSLLQVEVKYQRRGLGEYVTALMAKRIAELKNMDATATVIDINAPSRRLFDKLGFKVINHINWVVRPAIPSNKNE